jgi:hypothetical protein
MCGTVLRGRPSQKRALLDWGDIFQRVDDNDDLQRFANP